MRFSDPKTLIFGALVIGLFWDCPEVLASRKLSQTTHANDMDRALSAKLLEKVFRKDSKAPNSYSITASLTLSSIGEISKAKSRFFSECLRTRLQISCVRSEITGLNFLSLFVKCQ